MPYPTVFKPAYRLWHLRRLWQLCLIPPMLGIICATAYPPNDGTSASAIATPLGAVIILGLWAVGSAAYLIRWPRLPLEVLALSVTTALILGIAPAIALIYPGLLALMLLALPGLVLTMVIAITGFLGRLLFVGPKVARHFTASADSHLGAEQVIAALRLDAGLDGPMGQSGTKDSDGHFAFRIPAPPELQPIIHGADDPGHCLHHTWDCMAQIIDESPRHQLQSMIPQAEPHKETRILLRAEPQQKGARVWMDEFETDLPLGCAVLFQLIGLHDDYLRARIDRAEGRPSPAIRFAEVTSPVLMFARWLAREKAASR